jgi:hypothetical protein
MSTRVLANGDGFPGSRHTLPHWFDERADTSFRAAARSSVRKRAWTMTPFPFWSCASFASIVALLALDLLVLAVTLVFIGVRFLISNPAGKVPF